MNSRERVLTALSGGQPDCVPFMYNYIDHAIQESLLGGPVAVETVNSRNSWGYLARPGETTEVLPLWTIAPEVVKKLNLDAMGIQVLPPLFVDAGETEGRAVIKDGLITGWDALRKVRLPDPDDDRLFKQISTSIAPYRGEYALFAKIRLGASPTLLSMGMTGFSYSMCDDPDLVAAVLQLYTDWSRRLSRNLGELGFDFFWSFDDIAFKTAPMFSPDIFRDYFLPAMQHAASGLSRPWVYHSDGNLTSLLPDLVRLGMSGLHPLEPGAMDLDWLKSTYGRQLCLIGNINIDSTLSRGSIEDVDREVAERIRQLGLGGGYILSDSNSIPYYCRAENVAAVSSAMEKYRYIY